MDWGPPHLVTLCFQHTCPFVDLPAIFLKGLGQSSAVLHRVEVCRAGELERFADATHLGATPKIHHPVPCQENVNSNV
jgi:hypothetical protein